jgi:hypothetical protein
MTAPSSPDITAEEIVKSLTGVLREPLFAACLVELLTGAHAIGIDREALSSRVSRRGEINYAEPR